MDHAPEINLNEEYLFALSCYETSYPSLISNTQACYPMGESSDNQNRSAGISSDNPISKEDILELFE